MHGQSMRLFVTVDITAATIRSNGLLVKHKEEALSVRRFALKHRPDLFAQVDWKEDIKDGTEHVF